MSKPFFPWMGGKRRLSKNILPLFPDHTCYVEAFAGAGALFFAKEPAKVEVLNDIDGDIVNLYRVVKHHLDEFCRQFRWALHAREIHKWAYDTPPETLTDIQRGARFYYLLKCGFGAQVGTSFGTSATAPPKLNLLRLEEDLSAAHLRLARTSIERLDWRKVVEKYDRAATLFYFDPPYWGTTGYGHEFTQADYQALADTVRSLKGKAIVSLNDRKEVRALFKGLRIQSVPITYFVGGSKNYAPRRELIIKSW